MRQAQRKESERGARRKGGRSAFPLLGRKANNLATVIFTDGALSVLQNDMPYAGQKNQTGSSEPVFLRIVTAHKDVPYAYIIFRRICDGNF